MINFDLENTLFCGQSFCWRKEGEFYVAVLNNKVYRINEKSEIEDPFLIHYLDMDFDYQLALSKIRKMDPFLDEAVTKCNEIHILNQDLWETIIGFILSQNNNIKRIEGLYDTLCRTYGNEVEEGYFSFPRPHMLKDVTEEDLRNLKVGFRAPYILDAIKNAQVLLSIEDKDDREADEILQSVKGIGPKVSSCIRLFSLHRLNAFPKDVWIKKIMKLMFEGKDESIFYPYAGLAQQYLFHYARLGYLLEV
ncbi:MAG: DNA glycosylase [Sphaerochaetaceae bacterium]|nr:DNA glycosylase [Sphaerochaetaceae bacterium]